MPSAVMSSVCTGRFTPSTIDGVTSDAASLPTIATPRALMKGMIEAWKPAALRPTGHGPTFSRRAQRPVRSRIASPDRSSTPAFFSHASTSSW